jgi:hypothetical protein
MKAKHFIAASLVTSLVLTGLWIASAFVTFAHTLTDSEIEMQNYFIRQCVRMGIAAMVLQAAALFAALRIR